METTFTREEMINDLIEIENEFFKDYPQNDVNTTFKRFLTNISKYVEEEKIIALDNLWKKQNDKLGVWEYVVKTYYNNQSTDYLGHIHFNRCDGRYDE